MLAHSSQMHSPPVRQLVTLCPQSVYREPRVPLVIDFFYAVWNLSPCHEPHFGSKSIQGDSFTIINPI